MVLYPVYLATHQQEFERTTQLAALLASPPEKVELAQATQFADCVFNGPLPDPECTPGAIFENVTTEMVCTPGYSKKVRKVSVKTKQKAYAMYGIKYPQPFGAYEVDHFIALSLGGSNDISNLWPLPAEPAPGFKEKNILVNYLHEEVCAGNISLQAAQQQIANNWVALYENMDPKRIEELNKKYPSWADRKVK